MENVRVRDLLQSHNRLISILHSPNLLNPQKYTCLQPHAQILVERGA